MSPTVLRILMQRRRGIATLLHPSCNSKFIPITDIGKEPVVFVELDTRHNDGYTVSLEWNRDTGKTRIVLGDIRTASQLVFAVPAAKASDAFRHPFRYAP